jgi:hypothetical protein
MHQNHIQPKLNKTQPPIDEEKSERKRPLGNAGLKRREVSKKTKMSQNEKNQRADSVPPVFG